MTIDRASSRVAEGAFGRAMLFATLWMLACAAVAVAMDVTLGPSSRRYTGGLFVWVGLIGGLVIARLAWTRNASRAKQAGEAPPA
jgi:protein-S-isoprenylcysteine O-methyltransferase Ste14